MLCFPLKETNKKMSLSRVPGLFNRTSLCRSKDMIEYRILGALVDCTNQMKLVVGKQTPDGVSVEPARETISQ